MPNTPVTPHSPATILVLNSGSSSLKTALFAADAQPSPPRLLLAANASGIGQAEGKLAIKDFRDDPAGKPPTLPPRINRTNTTRTHATPQSLRLRMRRRHARSPRLALGHPSASEPSSGEDTDGDNS